MLESLVEMLKKLDSLIEFIDELDSIIIKILFIGKNWKRTINTTIILRSLILPLSKTTPRR